jgi:hypothetical protein
VCAEKAKEVPSTVNKNAQKSPTLHNDLGFIKLCVEHGNYMVILLESEIPLNWAYR